MEPTPQLENDDNMDTFSPPLVDNQEGDWTVKDPNCF